MVLFQKMFYETTSFNQKLCWKLPEDQPVKSFQVFCFTEGGKFDPDCVDRSVLTNANRRCNNWLDDYLAPILEFGECVVDAWEDLCDFFANLCN